MRPLPRFASTIPGVPLLVLTVAVVAIAGSLVAAFLWPGRSAATAEGAAYRVTVERCPGTERAVATGVAVAPDLVASVAHPFTEVREIALQATDGSITTSELVYLDTAKDIALLRLTTDPDRVLTIGQAEEGSAVTVVTYALESGPVDEPAIVERLVNATLDGAGDRQAVKLAASIGRGDSGAPVVDRRGELVAMIFATTRNQEVGWAVAGAEIEAAIASLDGSRPAVSLPAC